MRALKLGFITLCACALLAAMAFLPDRLCFEGGESYTFYCGTSSADCKVIIADKFASVEKLCLKNVCGESVEYENLDIESFLRKYNGKIEFTEELSDSVNYYCSANLPYSVELYGKEINLHVCVRDGKAKVASPIIFGGY